MDQSIEKSDLSDHAEPAKGSQGVPGKAKDKTPVAASSKLTKQRKPRSMKSKNEKPARPLSAYNVFFKEERLKWLAESEDKDEDKNKCAQLGYEMGQRWKKLSTAEKMKYNKLAKEDVKRYQKDMEKWEQREASPKRAKGAKSPRKAGKDVKEKVEKVEKAEKYVQSSLDNIAATRRVSNGQSPAVATQMGALGIDPQELMIQQLLASQHGASLGHQMNAQIPSLAGQLSEREAILRQLQLQELASRQTPHLSQLLGGGVSQFMGSAGYPASGNYLQALSGGGGHAIQHLPGIEQQLLIQRLRENELRSQMASLERGLAAQQYQFQPLPGQVNVPLSNLDLLAMQASSQQGPFPPSDSEVLANMSVREKLQLLMQLNQQGY